MYNEWTLNNLIRVRFALEVKQTYRPIKFKMKFTRQNSLKISSIEFNRKALSSSGGKTCGERDFLQTTGGLTIRILF
jgi:hypothetical protein